jgi:hypothetical protein
MEFTPFVALRPALLVLALSGAELTEIFSCPWRHICEKFQLQTAQWLTYRDTSMLVWLTLVVF